MAVDRLLNVPFLIHLPIFVYTYYTCTCTCMYTAFVYILYSVLQETLEYVGLVHQSRGSASDSTSVKYWEAMLSKTYDVIDKVTINRYDGWMDGWMDGLMDRWMDGWMDGWMNGWKDGWMEGRMDHV